MKPPWLDCWRWFYAIALVRFREIVTQVELADRFLGKPRGANISCICQLVDPSKPDAVANVSNRAFTGADELP